MVDSWVDVTRRIFAHPAVKVAVALDHNSIVLSIWKHLSEHVEALLGSIWLPDCVVASTEKADLQTFESLQIIRCDQVHEVGQITSNVVRRFGAHARKVSQEVHVDAVEVLVEPGMRRTV